MNTTLSKFMTVALAVIVVTGLLYQAIMPVAENRNDHHNNRIEQDLQLS